MGFFLASEDGFVCDLGSATAWDDVIQAVDKLRTTGALAAMLKEGLTEDPKAVIHEISQLLPQIKDADVRPTLKSLRAGLKKVKEIGIITQ